MADRLAVLRRVDAILRNKYKNAIELSAIVPLHKSVASRRANTQIFSTDLPKRAPKDSGWVRPMKHEYKVCVDASRIDKGLFRVGIVVRDKDGEVMRSKYLKVRAIDFLPKKLQKNVSVVDVCLNDITFGEEIAIGLGVIEAVEEGLDKEAGKVEISTDNSNSYQQLVEARNVRNKAHRYVVRGIQAMTELHLPGTILLLIDRDYNIAADTLTKFDNYDVDNEGKVGYKAALRINLVFSADLLKPRTSAPVKYGKINTADPKYLERWLEDTADDH